MKFLIVLLFSSAAYEASLSQSKIELEFSNRVSQERLQQTVRDLVALGNRQGGTRSGDQSVAYLLKQFRSVGLKAEVLEDPERLTFVNDRWSLKVVSPASLRGLFVHAWLAGFSPSVRVKKAQIVCISSENDLDTINVDRTAVLTNSTNAGRLYDRIVSKGAVCVLTWTDVDSKAYSDCALITSLPPTDHNPIPVFDISRNDSRALLKRLRSHEEVFAEFSSRTRMKNGRAKSVVATLPGKKGDYFLVCAHGDSDSGGPGADDNASGVAGVLELAKTFARMRKEKIIGVPDSSIKFIVWGSEYASTENYVKQNSSDLKKILTVFNYDEIGTGATRNCLYFEGNDQRVNQALMKELQKVGEDFAGKKSFWRESTTNPSQGHTDSYVFLPNYLSRLGVPAVKIPSVTVYTAAWDEPRALFQPKEWRTKAWKGPKDSVYVDYSLYYHSSMDVPEMTTDREPYDMVWGVKAVGIALLRILWRK